MTRLFTFRSFAGLVSVLVWAATAAAQQNSVAIAPDPSGKFGKFAYAVTETGNVFMYRIDATTGALTSIGLVATGDVRSKSVTVDPTGKFAYVANVGNGDNPGSITMYTIDAVTGALMSTGMILARCDLGACQPRSVAVHPSGKFAYVANNGPLGAVSVYDINATTGRLALDQFPVSGGRALSVAVDPTGKFAYVVNEASQNGTGSNVAMYMIETTNGLLFFTGIIDAGSFPTSIAIDPSGKFAYVTNSGSNDVSMYIIDTTTGLLTFTGIIDAGSVPSSIATDPSGRFAYVTNSGSNDVSMYTIDPATGALTFIGIIDAGSAPSSIAIDPSGKFAYVANSGSNDPSMYTIDTATGALTPIGQGTSENLLVRGDFEDYAPPDLGPPGWIADTRRQIAAKSETNQPHSGLQNGACWATDAQDCGMFQGVTAPGTGVYTLTYFANADRDGGLVGASVNDNLAASSSVAVRGFGNYGTMYSISFNAVAGDTIWVWMYSPPSPGYVVIDDVSLTFEGLGQ